MIPQKPIVGLLLLAILVSSRVCFASDTFNRLSVIYTDGAKVYSEAAGARDMRELATKYSTKPIRGKTKAERKASIKTEREKFKSLAVERQRVIKELHLKAKGFDAVLEKVKEIEETEMEGIEEAYRSGSENYIKTLRTWGDAIKTSVRGVIRSDEVVFNKYREILQINGVLPITKALFPAKKYTADLECDSGDVDIFSHLAEMKNEADRIRPWVYRLSKLLKEIRPKKGGTKTSEYLDLREERRKPLEAWHTPLKGMYDQISGCMQTYEFKNVSVELQTAYIEKNHAQIELLQDAMAASYVTSIYFEVKNALQADEKRFGNATLPIDIPPKTKTASDPDAYAIVIGISKYRNIPEAKFADRDAKSIHSYLTKAMGFPKENVKLLLNENAGKADLEKYLGKWLKNQVTAASRVLIFYAGHGAPDPVSGETFLVPHDGDPSYLQETAVSINRVNKMLAALPSKDVTLIIDSCFSGAGGRSVLPEGARPLVTKIRQDPIGDNTITLTASKSDQISTFYPKGRHGLLTYFLLRGLQGKADVNGDDKISLAELFQYVQPNVKREAKKQNVDQVPTMRSKLDGKQKSKRIWISVK